MKIRKSPTQRGIALIIVMIVVVVLGLLAGSFAYTMKVETQLARNASWDTELEWLGRSGIELAKYVLAQPAAGGQQFDSLNQKWAGGPGDTNGAMADISLEDNELGSGRFSIKIADMERRFNINASPEEILRQACLLIGTDAAETPVIVNAIQDWIDPDDDPHIGSTHTESDYYTSLRPPYRAKNGPIDDISELLLIRGITPGMVWGSHAPSGFKRPDWREEGRNGDSREEPSYPIGFNDLFAAISARQVNINTVSANTLQLVPDIDANLAQAILITRAGPDGVDGTEDDTPFRSVAELGNVPGMNRTFLAAFARYFGVPSQTFEIQVDTQIDQAKRSFVAVLRRNGVTLDTLYVYWK